MAGEPVPEGGGSWVPRFERAALGFERLAKGSATAAAFDDAFVDALCEPPQSFTYGGVLVARAHATARSGARRWPRCCVELGASVPSYGDPIVWEDAQSARIRMARNATTS